MGWLSKIFKGSNHKVSTGRHDWRYASDTVENRQCASLDSWSGIEDIDRSIASSLSEEDQKGRHLIDSEPRLGVDEVLAKSFHERLNDGSSTESGSRNYNENGNRYGYGYETDNLYQPITLPYSTSLRICAGCNSDIGHGRFLSCMNAVWHPECFRCRGCKQPISDYEQFSVSSSHPYHKACYKESHYPKCDICKHFIPTNAAGLIEYRAHPFWSQKYCPNHEHDGTPRCCSCERLESWNARFAALKDDRRLCSECLDSAIMDTNQCQPLVLDIQKFYEGLNMKLTQKVPLLLVDKQSLNEAIGGDSHIVQRPSRGIGNRVTGMRKEPYKLKRHCEVTAILILYGLPRILTGTILAHETMHAWLRLNGYRTLREDVEEGICQVLASMWLESQILSMSDTNNPSFSSASSSSAFTSSKKGKRSSFDRKLAKFFKQHIATDTSLVYGNGFRAANQAVLKFGLARTLDHLHKTGNFPG
ncbi:hypothetical protein BUALT_Bualt01G0035400 [Buddleja alternifolia]|uniref:LIM zinc-binding domain-containing protein n=1 Tax=Buddleja alternifolia TaxID=168488 RepID=A0AAV6Y468_9LAMI|nr:hypothetical protein BUALT_Bualt01G0035400 [Buddleja alternifolia]